MLETVKCMQNFVADSRISGQQILEHCKFSQMTLRLKVLQQLFPVVKVFAWFQTFLLPSLLKTELLIQLTCYLQTVTVVFCLFFHVQVIYTLISPDLEYYFRPALLWDF